MERINEMPVNAENALKVADAIEKRTVPHLGFNMNYMIAAANNDFAKDGLNVDNCDTVACIAGWTNVLGGKRWSATYSFAGDYLGLRPEQHDQLFYASNHPDADEGDEYGPLTEISPEQAVRTLRHLAETGEVDWTA
jgi:hypothetical protein